MLENDRDGSILYHENQISTCDELAKTLNIRPISFVHG